MATVREIAELAGVSPSTVSRVLNGNVPVKESARNKVLSAIARLDGKQTESANAGLKGNIGIIMPSSSARNLAGHPSLYSTVLCFIETLSLHDIGNTTILLDENFTAAALRCQAVRGFLILGTSQEQEEKLLPMLSEMAIPFIFINRLMGNKHASCVNIDDEQATDIAMNFLLELGHRRIAFIGGNPDYRNTKLRYQSYIGSLRRFGIEPDSELVLYGEYSERSGEALAEQMIRLKELPTAVCAASDTIAIGFMRYLSGCGMRLPEDMSVIGFGDIEASAYVTPKLTTIAQNSREMGRVAAVTLLQMIDCPVICRQQILLRTELVIRESTAAPKKTL